MEATVSTSFIYRNLGRFFRCSCFDLLSKNKRSEYKRNPIYYAGIFFIVSNIVYHVSSPNDVASQLKMKNMFSPPVCEMKTGQPTF